jgi:hypothetical protein
MSEPKIVQEPLILAVGDTAESLEVIAWDAVGNEIPFRGVGGSDPDPQPITGAQHFSTEILFDIGSKDSPSDAPSLGTPEKLSSEFSVIPLVRVGDFMVYRCEYSLFIHTKQATKGTGEGYRVWLPRELDLYLPSLGEAEPEGSASLWIAQGASPHLFSGSMFWTTRKWAEQDNRGKFVWIFDHDEWGTSNGTHPKNYVGNASEFKLRSSIWWKKAISLTSE